MRIRMTEMKIRSTGILAMKMKSTGILAMSLLLVLAGMSVATAQSGNRIWEEGMNTTYTWNAFSFSGFYYDLDTNMSTEELIIHNINNKTKSIRERDINYKTSPIEATFGYSAFGKYKIIGFMADRYFAGYTAKSVISGNKDISVIGSGQLQRILLNDDNKHVVSVGGTLTLQEGYVLKIKQVDIGAGPGQVLIGLLKDGTEIDSSVVAGGDNYIFSKKVGSLEIPIIAAHIDSVFRGTEVNAIFIKGIFQISEVYTSITSNNRYGIMEITEVSNNVVRMENSHSIDLSPGNTVDLMGNLKIIVADNSSILRFALSTERTGTYEVRGTIYPVVREWTPLNFGLNIGKTSIGFYYDMDNGIGGEDLKVSSAASGSIPTNGLVYSTSPQKINFDHSGFGQYSVIGFMADKYFAGYSSNNIISKNKEISVIESGQLQKVLLDDDTQRVAAEGGTITLKEGYVIKITSVDIGAGPGQVWINLLKDGNKVDDDVITAGDTYIYSKKIGSVNDLPIIAVRFENVFRGTEVNAAFTRGIFQISEQITSIKSGDRFGVMEISNVGNNQIKMENPSSIGISRGSTIDIMGNIKLKVADSGIIRFYPFVLVTPEMVANQLIIESPSKASAGDSINIKVTAKDIPIDGATIAIDSGTGQTDITGNFVYTIPRTFNGTYNITATKLGYEKAVKSIEITGYISNKLIIDAPTTANQFDAITIHITYNNTPISGVNIFYDNTSIGFVDNDGTISYTLKESGTHTISALRPGYITAMRDIDVKVPFSEFKALDINITPNIGATGQIIQILSNITNAGTKEDTLPVILLVNGTEVNNQSIDIKPSEIKQINLTYKISVETGNYTVEILGQKGSLQVIKKAPSVGIIGVIAILFIVYLMRNKKRKSRIRNKIKI